MSSEAWRRSPLGPGTLLPPQRRAELNMDGAAGGPATVIQCHLREEGRTVESAAGLKHTRHCISNSDQ